MKYTTALIALATAVSAQDISVFPQCSLSCIVSAVGTTTCGTDFECVCKDMEAVKAAALPCVTEACGEDVTNSTSPQPLLHPASTPSHHPPTHATHHSTY